MGEIFIGTSGFASPSARSGTIAGSGAATDLLAGYATRFDAVELDSVFYRAPSKGTVGAWSEATEGRFRFSVRVPRELTHVDRLGMPMRAARFAERLGPLGPRLGCLLFTTPPTFERDLGRLDGVLDALPGVGTAWEFRHPSWFESPEAFDLLAQRGATPVIVDNHDGTGTADLLPGGDRWHRWSFPAIYVRFRKDRYRPGDLFAWGEMLSEALAAGRDVYAFFKQSPEAALYAIALAELLVDTQSRLADARRQQERLDGTLAVRESLTAAEPMASTGPRGFVPVHTDLAP